MKVLITNLVLDSRLQPRDTMNSDAIKDYADAYAREETLPPIMVFSIQGDLVVVDGFHRVEAAKKAQLSTIDATVQEGSFTEARLYVASVNTAHGVRRTQKDKRRQVAIVLDEMPAWADREIARHCGVSDPFVGKMRRELDANVSTSATRPNKINRHYQRNGTTEVGLYHNESEREATLHTNMCNERDEEPATISRDVIEQTFPAPAAPLQLLVQEQPDTRPKAVFNQVNEQIDWAKWSWNPVTGCLHNCVYCYARDIAERFYEEKFAPTFRPERLTAPHHTKVPDKAAQDIGWKNVFVCSMADLFGKWVPQEWIDAVMQEVYTAPQWNFLFLTKFPQRLDTIHWTENCWVGTSVDEQPRVKIAEKHMAKVKAPVRWLSLEPLLTPLKFSSLSMFDWIVIGGQSKNSQVGEFQPQWEWVEELLFQARRAGCMVYFKPNLKCRPQEYPAQTTGAV